jgi:two-component system, OmpR family, phosphate regulon response regulator OmpR
MPGADQSHILVVDDDRRIRELLRDYLSAEGFAVTLAGTATQARALFASLAFDLVILDVMMPGESGLALAADLRLNQMNTPILMLSALADVDDRVRGLESGSDDYLSKPFDPRELLLRLRALLRRVDGPAIDAQDVRFGSFTFNKARAELRQNNVMVKLTSREKEILRALASQPGLALSRQHLASQASGESARGVDVQVNRLRQKIELDPSNPVYLQTMRGTGYALFIDEGQTR